jgi:hypothetical protein
MRKEEIVESKGIQFPASRSPRDYNLTLIAMEEYAESLHKQKMIDLSKKISEIQDHSWNHGFKKMIPEATVLEILAIK